jgi:hypothetical protein
MVSVGNAAPWTLAFAKEAVMAHDQNRNEQAGRSVATFAVGGVVCDIWERADESRFAAFRAALPNRASPESGVLCVAKSQLRDLAAAAELASDRIDLMDWQGRLRSLQGAVPRR